MKRDFSRGLHPSSTRASASSAQTGGSGTAENEYAVLPLITLNDTSGSSVGAGSVNTKSSNAQPGGLQGVIGGVVDMANELGSSPVKSSETA